ncbi:MAG TPA: TetR/AcrR family transcriptional regulator [Spirochaetota bacterium]|nr:TetR/AcrR family transcriptional regulator [Spirochaetota bacterium]
MTTADNRKEAPELRVPKQKRGIKTKTRILKAAIKLFAKKGIHGTNTKEIAAKAGVSIGSFYSYFSDKKTLLLDVLDDFLKQIYSKIWESEITDRSAHEYNGDYDSLYAEIRGIVMHVMEAYDLSPEFHRQTHALRYSDPDINRLYEEDRKREIQQIQRILGLIDGRMRISDPDAAAIVIHNAVESVAHTAKFLGSSMEEKRLINELTDMLYYYIIRASD